MAWPTGHLCGPKVMLILHSIEAKQLFSFNNKDVAFMFGCMTISCSLKRVVLLFDFNLQPEQQLFFFLYLPEILAHLFQMLANLQGETISHVQTMVGL